MGLAHDEALKAKSEEIEILNGKTFISIVPHGTELPYLVWHPARGTNTSDRLSAPHSTKHPRYTGHITGVTGEQVGAIGDLLEALLFPGGRGITINVPGEAAKPLWFESPLPIQVREEPQPTIAYQVVEVGWDSPPA